LQRQRKLHEPRQPGEHPYRAADADGKEQREGGVMANADELRDANPWHPISNAVDLKHLGKLAEELSEAGAAVARCIIQGMDEAEPVTGRINRQWLQDELADVLANVDLVIDQFKLDRPAMTRRQVRKKQHLRQWHALA
jgi:hypothetical protein